MASPKKARERSAGRGGAPRRGRGHKGEGREGTTTAAGNAPVADTDMFVLCPSSPAPKANAGATLLPPSPEGLEAEEPMAAARGYGRWISTIGLGTQDSATPWRWINNSSNHHTSTRLPAWGVAELLHASNLLCVLRLPDSVFVNGMVTS